MTAERDRLADRLHDILHVEDEGCAAASFSACAFPDGWTSYADRLIAAGVGFREDPFWGGPVRPHEPVTDVASLRMEMTAEEADAFMAAIEEPSADLDVERLARALLVSAPHPQPGPVTDEDIAAMRGRAAAIAAAYREVASG